jgi:hypothetical protein
MFRYNRAPIFFVSNGRPVQKTEQADANVRWKSNIICSEIITFEELVGPTIQTQPRHRGMYLSLKPLPIRQNAVDLR